MLKRWAAYLAELFEKLGWKRKEARPGQRPQQGPPPQLQGRLALGLGLASYFETQACLDQLLLNQISWLRRELFMDTGVVVPSLTVVQERALHPFEYSLTFGQRELARGSILPSHWLVTLDEIPERMGERERGRHPVTGGVTSWLTANELRMALSEGLRCEDGLEVFAHHLRHALWQNTTHFVSLEFCQQYLAQGLERSPQVRTFRRVLESNQGRLASLMQLVLAMGGSLRDPGRVLSVAGAGFLRGESIETLAKRVVDQAAPNKEPELPSTQLSTALLYSYFWNEHLSGDLISRADPAGLENLALGMLEVQNLPPSSLEHMWMETLSRSEFFLLGRSAELADQLHQMLHQQQRPSRLGRSEQAAILLLSLPKESGQMVASTLIRSLGRSKVEELVQAMGRFGYLLLQAPPGQGMRQLTDLGFRERIIGEFLDYVNYQSLEPQPRGRDWLSAWLRRQKQVPLDELAYAVERYYFPSLEPITRLRRCVEQDPLRFARALVSFTQGEKLPLSATRRAPLALSALTPELVQGIIGRLQGRGCNFNGCQLEEEPKERNQCEWEFFSRVMRPFSSWQGSLRR